MGKQQDDDEPTQTTPEGAEREALGLPGVGGNEIPVPDREDVLAALHKAAKPRSSDRESGPDK